MKVTKLFILIPVIGSVIFTALYYDAASLYPGGSQADKNTSGFSWMHNYWCNLLNENAINGQVNKARHIALTAMFILCLGLSFFWIYFPKYLALHKRLTLLMQFTGVAAMLAACFLFTGINHDLVINTACFFGLIAVIIVFITLKKRKWFLLFKAGLLNIVLIALNNYCYYTKAGIVYLPLVQK